MRDYLEGYLDIIPPSQKSKVQEALKSSRDIAGPMTEAEFINLIDRIAEDHTQLTEIVEQGEMVASREYNQFFNNVQVDLNVMFTEADLVERALASYERLYDGIIADLSKEIKALRERINTIKLVADGEEGVIVKTIDFTNATEMETDRGQYAHLFLDRDGTSISDVIIHRDSDVSYLCLGKTSQSDKIRDQSGATVVKLRLEDERGTRVTQNKYPIDNATDESPDSYWGEVVLVNEPINTPMDNFPAGGAMVKFTATLPRPEIVSEISLSPFTTMPLEIVSIKYESDIETFQEPIELLTEKKESTDTMIIQFPNIIARRFTFVLRQKNYTKNTYLVYEQELEKADLWDKISKREVEVTLDSPTSTVAQEDLNVYSGWDIYLGQLQKHEQELAEYMTRLQAYQVAYAKYQEEVTAYKAQYDDYKAKVNEYNTNFNRYGYSAVLKPSSLE